MSDTRADLVTFDAQLQVMLRNLVEEAAGACEDTRIDACASAIELLVMQHVVLFVELALKARR